MSNAKMRKLADHAVAVVSADSHAILILIHSAGDCSASRARINAAPIAPGAAGLIRRDHECGR